MTEPIRINCKWDQDIPDVKELARLADAEHHVVLVLPHMYWYRPEKVSVIMSLSEALPNHSVFDSGGDKQAEWITIKSVISQSTVLDQLDKFNIALTAYIETCDKLIAQREAGSLPSEWTEDKHGGHVCFYNEETGETIDAPLFETHTLDKVDPYFFSVFVKTSGRFPAVAELLHDDFHDARRMLDIIIKRRESQQNT